MRVHRLPDRATTTHTMCGTKFPNPSPDQNSPVAVYTCTCNQRHPKPHVAHMGNLPVAIAWDDEPPGTPNQPPTRNAAEQAPPDPGATCSHCRQRPAAKKIFTMLIRTGQADATKRTMHVCDECAAAAARWLEAIGLVVTTTADGNSWDAVVENIREQ